MSINVNSGLNSVTGTVQTTVNLVGANPAPVSIKSLSHSSSVSGTLWTTTAGKTTYILGALMSMAEGGTTTGAWLTATGVGLVIGVEGTSTMQGEAVSVMFPMGYAMSVPANTTVTYSQGAQQYLTIIVYYIEV